MQEKAKARERRINIGDQLFLVRRMGLVPKFCGVYVVQFLLVFAYIVVIQASKQDLFVRQIIVAWAALAVFTWTLIKQVYMFFKSFQRMVSDSKIEMHVSTAAEYEFILVQSLTFLIGAVLVSMRTRETRAFYFAHVMGALAVALAANAYLVYVFNKPPSDKEIDSEIEEREKGRKQK